MHDYSIDCVLRIIKLNFGHLTRQFLLYSKQIILYFDLTLKELEICTTLYNNVKIFTKCSETNLRQRQGLDNKIICSMIFTV